MRFSMFTTVHATGGARSPAETLDFFREQVILGDQLGFRVIWIGEHHFGPYGQGDFPNPIVLGADLAARTEHIRIGQMANIAVWWHPIRLAEDIAILDQLTKGRVEAGFGRGIWPYEGPQFHPHADPQKDAENRELFREVVECVKKVWTQEYFSHEGPNFRFPAPGTVFNHPMYPSDPRWQDGEQVTALRVTPKTFQKPHPPLWCTVSTDRSVSMAAELGLKGCYWQPPARQIRERCKVYSEVRSRRDGVRYRLGQNQAVLRNTYVADSMEQAKREAEAGIMSIFQYNDPYRGTRVFMNPGEKPDPGLKLSWDFLESRALLVGSPAHIIERLEEQEEICPLDEYLVGYAHNGVSQRNTLRNLERFATEVIPYFEKREADQRRAAAAG